MSEKSLKYLPYLDGWRGLAICFLLIGHFFPVPGINLGSAGVNLFFVLSGFLMARLLFVDEVPLTIFYKRRIARIFPAVFCFLAIATAAYAALGKPLSWTELASAAAFVINYFPGQPGAAVMPFGHIWSLCVEEHSYILLSIVALCARRMRALEARWAVGVLAALSAAIGFGYWLGYQGQHLEFDRWIHSEVSAYGILVSAFILLAGRGRISKLPGVIVPALIFGGFALHWWSVPAPVRTVFGVGAFALAVNLLDRAPLLMQRALSWRPVRQIGLWSFSIYLWQQPFYLYVSRNGMSPWLGVGLALVAGIASFYLLENPARIYLNRKWGRQPPAMPENAERSVSVA